MSGPGRLTMLWMALFCGLTLLSSGPAVAESGGSNGESADATVTAQRMGDHGDKTRFVLEFSRETDFSILTLTDPERIILDFPATDWRATSGGPGVGLIRRTEVGLSADGKRRVLLTLAEPVAITDAFFIPERDGAPVRFVLDIVPDSQEASASASAASDEAVSAGNGTEHESSGSAASSTASNSQTVQASLPADVPDFPPPRRRPATGSSSSDGSGDQVAMFDSASGVNGPSASESASRSAAAETSVPVDAVPLPPSRPNAVSGTDNGNVSNSNRTETASLDSAGWEPVSVAGVPFDVPMPPTRPDRPAVRTVVIDPGHGGIDPGAIGASGAVEKTIVLQAARMIRDSLQARGGYRVVLTRDGDETLRLRDRVRIAREADGDLFLSIHADSMENERVRGASVYTLSEVASDREAEMLAARENRADALAGVVLDPNDDMVASILIDLAQRDTKNQSRLVADHLVSGLGNVSRMLSNSHRQAGFAVLTAPDVPSVLIELGYLSNETDERLLRDPDHLRTMASAIAGAIDDYFRTPNLVGLARR